jgi:hypothetical protein
MMRSACFFCRVPGVAAVARAPNLQFMSSYECDEGDSSCFYLGFFMGGEINIILWKKKVSLLFHEILNLIFGKQ